MLDALASAADRALDEARRAISVLSSGDPPPLPVAIAQTAEDMCERSLVALALEVDADIRVPAYAVENLLRILREAIVNAGRHGLAEKVTVRLWEDDRVHLTIEDDGRGFDPVGADERLRFDQHARAGTRRRWRPPTRVRARAGHAHRGDAVTDVVRVLIADDHARTRASVRQALEDDGGFVVCAEAEDGPSAFDRAIETRPDVCLLDINMPGSGIAATARIAAALPGTPIVILTVSRDDNDLFDALRAGASGYLLKDLGDDQVAPAVRKVLAGEASLPGTLVARLVEEFRDREHRRIGIAPEQAARLTGREWDVLELMREGLSTNEIGTRLFVSPTTVRTHVSSVLKKLQVPDRDAAVRLLEASSPQPR